MGKDDEGLVGKVKSISDRYNDFLERAKDPLKGTDAMKIRSLTIDGLVTHPDSESMGKNKHPSALYLFLDGQYIGTAYGSKVVAPLGTRLNPGALEAIRTVESAYLHADPETYAEPEKKSDYLQSHSFISYGFFLTIANTLDALSRNQVWKLKQFWSEGVETRPRDIDISRKGFPGIVSFYYHGRHVCNAYGNTVLPTLHGIFSGDPNVKLLIQDVRDCYLKVNRYTTAADEDTD